MYSSGSTRYAINTVYQAATDGFVMAHSIVPHSNNLICYMSGKSDNFTPPTTLRTYSQDDVYSNGGAANLTMPVRKGDYWIIAVTAYGYTPQTSDGLIDFIPLGS
jgi:hypothetical protein